MSLRMRATAVVISNQKLLTFFAKDPQSQKEYYFLPGGSIEDHETAPETAIRETREETGYQIDVDTSSVIDVEYDFYWNGQTYQCLTFFYKGQLNPPLQVPHPVKDAEYNLWVEWIPLNEIENKLNYNHEILTTVLKIVNLT